MAPAISIIVPIYNVERYLEECLASICCQTLQGIEIICVNDGSTDSSGEIVRRMSRQDPRIILIEQENQGLASARNSGIKCAQGHYVGFVDSDDRIAPDMFEKLYYAAEEQSADMVQCAIEPIIECNDPRVEAEMRRNFEAWAKLREGEWIEDKCPLARFLSHELSNSVWNKLYRRIPTGLEAPLFFADGMRSSEDLDYTGRYITYCRKVCSISQRLYYYRQSRPGSLMTDWKKQLHSSLSDLQNALCRSITVWKEHHLLLGRESACLSWMQRYVHTLCEGGSPEYLSRLADVLDSVPIGWEHARALPRRPRKRVSIVLGRNWIRLKITAYLKHYVKK